MPCTRWALAIRLDDHVTGVRHQAHVQEEFQHLLEAEPGHATDKRGRDAVLSELLVGRMAVTVVEGVQEDLVGRAAVFLMFGGHEHIHDDIRLLHGKRHSIRRFFQVFKPVEEMLRGDNPSLQQRARLDVQHVPVCERKTIIHFFSFSEQKFKNFWWARIFFFRCQKKFKNFWWARIIFFFVAKKNDEHC